MGDGQDGTVVVLTALEVEYRAVRAHVTACVDKRHDSGTLFEVGWLNGTPWRIALAEIGDGNQGAAVLTERAIAMFRPQAVFFVGVAGALKSDDIRLGDVVVATHVHHYHGGKEDNGEFLARPRGWPAPYELTEIAKHVRRTDSWAEPLLDTPGALLPKVHLKPIAAGEVVLNSMDSPLRRQLRWHYENAVAIEMESAGMAHAAHLNKSLPALTVRGISDRADGGKYSADAGGWQTIASRNAAAFAFSIIRRMPYEQAEPGGGAVAAAPTPLAVRSAPGPSPRSIAAGHPRQEWRGGGEIAVGERRYLLCDDFLDERSAGDHSLMERQALAMRLALSADAASGYTWLRQVEARRPTASARSALKALERERDLLTGLRRVGGLPRLELYAPGGRTSTLALTWPVSPVTGAPCETLAAVYGLGEESLLDSWRLHRLLTGLSGLCNSLEALHNRGFSHRGLTPVGIVALDDGRLVLRDLGLASREPEPGEGPEVYRAPEQQRRGSWRPGPGALTDVYQLGAVAYHLVTGHPPLRGAPLPVRVHVPGVPASLDRAVQTALSADPAERPDARALAAALRSARDDLS
ncbi:hypothetical protein GCM10027168_62790 [Streptomyces capparidis]